MSAIVFFGAVSASVHAAQTIYTDSLQSGWVNWSWATVDVANASPTHGGSTSISVVSSNWQALYLHHNAQSGTLYTNLNFWINGGTGGQIVQLQATRNGAPQAPVVLAALPANSWRQESVPLSTLGVATANDFDGFWLQVQNSGVAPAFYIDDIGLDTDIVSPVNPTNGPVTVTINAALNQHPISPLIYGVAFASTAELAELNAPVNRSGGNSETRYNWQLNANNRGSDWYFESIPSGPATPGGAADDHVSNSKNAGAQPMLTVPMIGWMPKLTPSRSYTASYAITKYGPQTDHDTSYFLWNDFGNGIGTNSTTHATWLITTNDPTDANFLTNSLFQQEWIKHLTNQWGLATNGGVRYYCMDNEHTLWNSTHRDVHPIGTTMQEIRDKFFDYGGKVKAIDPNALLLAPEEWGWTGYFYSGFDAQWAGTHGWNTALMPDRSTNGSMDYMPWFLDQARQRATNTGQRLLDYFTLHYYPQNNEYQGGTSAALQNTRNRSTRSLWDPTYTDESWISDVVKLIPRMKGWVASYYPGTKIGITEYNWGAENHINGATAQADIYGIFGREGLDLATRWTTPAASTPTFKAMKMYRNYDGNKSTFGDMSVSASSSANADDISTFAALRTVDGALTVMAINKQLSSNAPVTFALTNFSASGTAQVWRLTSANTISQLANVNFTGSVFSNTLPAQSITLFVLPAAVVPPTPPTLLALGQAGGHFNFRINGQAGQRYAILASGNLTNWTYWQTNTLGSNSLNFAVPATNAQLFYRAQWLP